MKIAARWHVFGLVVSAVFFAHGAAAQSWPTKVVRVIVPVSAGGGIDTVARAMAQKYSEAWGQSVVVENRAGAGGIIGADVIAKAPRDGYTLLINSTSQASSAAQYAKLPYDALKDFTSVGITSTNTLLATIHASVPANTLQEFIAYAKANPGKIAAGVAGSGSMLHLATEMMKSQAGIDMLVVPYKASGPAAADLLGGQIQLLIDAPPVTMAHVKSGRLKVLGVTAKTRLAALPDTPTFDEAGLKGFDASGWQGVLVPAGTPPAMIARLSDALVKALAQAEVREKFASQGLDVASSTPEQFGVHIRAEIEKWGKIAKAANIKLD